MKKTDLIKAFNKDINLVRDKYTSQVSEYITRLKKDLEEASKGHKDLNKLTDFKSFLISSAVDLTNVSASNGFYAIYTSYCFSNDMCDIVNFSYKGKTYYSVYRGESSNCKERIDSHFNYGKQYNQGKIYGATMKLILSENDSKELGFSSCRINLERQFVLEENSNDNWKDMPTQLKSSNWIVFFLPLPESTTSLRTVFEKLYIKHYGSQIFGNDE